jgi:hypothetical protein
MTGRTFSKFNDEQRRRRVVEDPLRKPVIMPGGLFEPWSPGVSEWDRRAGLRALAALTAVFAGPSHRALAALRKAELSPETADEALAEFDRLPTLRRRQVVAVYARILRPPEPEGAS